MDETTAAIVAVVILGALAAGLVFHRGRTKREARRLADLLAAGRYEEAAEKALAHERYDEAIDYLLRAQKGARAAQLALKIGRSRQAAEIFEQVGDLVTALQIFEGAGIADRAREIREKLARAAREREVKLGSARPAAPDSLRSLMPMTAVGGRAETPEEEFRAALRLATMHEAEQHHVAALAERAVAWLTASGELRRAADVYRDAGLLDEAVQLYINVLGLPGEAAPLVEQLGHHQRAADLFAAAGQPERAAGVWVSLAKQTSSVEQALDRIEHIADGTLELVLRDLIAGRPVSRDTAEIYYRWAALLERRGQGHDAELVLREIARAVGDYRDVTQRVQAADQLRAAIGASGLSEAEALELAREALELRTERAKKLDPRAPVVAAKRTRAAGIAGDPTVVADGAPPRAATAYAATKLAGDPALSATVLAPDAQAGANAAALSATVLASQAVAGVRPAFADPARRSTVLDAALAPAASDAAELVDDLVRGTRDGPPVAELERWVRSHPCGAATVGVHYRLALACLGTGDYGGARAALETIVAFDATYRDAASRLARVRAYVDALSSAAPLAASPSATPSPPTASPTATGPSDAPKLGRYAIRGQLGQGGMGVVLRATDTVLGRDVALKFIVDPGGFRAVLGGMFESEAKAAAQLNHPNIVTVYDFGTLDDKAFIAMEYVEGQSVESMIEDRGRLGVLEAVQTIVQALTALEYAHQRRFVHRDVKPSNMMRTADGVIKLMDFGLARSLDGGGDQASLIGGTPAYMAPEQRVGVGVDHRADLYAVGASLYEMLTGSLLYEDPSKRAYVPLRERAPSCPGVLDEIILRATRVDPAERYQSARELIEPLERIASTVRRVMAVSAPRVPTAR